MTRKRGAANKGKYIATVVHDNTSVSENDSEGVEMEVGALESLANNMAAIDPDLLASFRCYAGPTSSAGQIPKFNPKNQD